MQANKVMRLPELIEKNESGLVSSWIKYQLAELNGKSESVSDAALKQQCREFLNLFFQACQNGSEDVQGQNWRKVREMLADLSSSRALQGFTPSETAMFVFSLKQPLFDLLRKEIKEAHELGVEIWTVTMLLDKLGLYTTEVYTKSREDVIKRQQREMLELSTPVFRLWDKVLALPLIGTLDSQRTSIIMEALLNQIVETGSKIAILDITGVPTVDTETAQHLLKTVAAARLMGAECIISGIRPQIAQTIVHLGVEIDVITTSTMADAAQEALAQVGYAIVTTQGVPSGHHNSNSNAGLFGARGHDDRSR
jgi:rsbT co-antagonist protein RsbR